MKNIKKIMNSFLEDYEENPEGWSYWTDRSGEFYDIYLLRDDEGYFLKLDSIYTQNPIGTGTKIKLDNEDLERDLSDFGFREFTKDELENFFYALSEMREEDEEESKKIIKNKMKEKMDQKPSSLSNFEKESMLLVGPFNRGKPFKDPSEDHREIEQKLTKKMKKKFRSDRPMYR